MPKMIKPIALTDFKLRYNLLQAPEESNPDIKDTLRQAAVLIALIHEEGEFHVLLTRRPTHLRSHPGQISFPGGKVELGDASLIETALREAAEEIALYPDNVEVIGQYPAMKTFSGFEITPVIGLVKEAFTPKLDPGEVDELFTVPLSYLLQAENRQKQIYQRHGIHHPVYFIRYREHLIWGATAAMINTLCKHLII
ncbi:CoA pyrophosphatase [Shewanella violacea]|uniref:MutT/nudix family protein n=1 Tax=Shewanella violacea (strain JCM 10179 / CIP 106290 / LMG 19151 / DSS12) TaxID=637905 RepID=D4ZJY7_SHEVD|nr:CoA pyrophosphatase [Shewanella violacea]BAJ01986.1 MutT/nudix family protein [Shewanella violacea DSS12]